MHLQQHLEQVLIRWDAGGRLLSRWCSATVYQQTHLFYGCTCCFQPLPHGLLPAHKDHFAEPACSQSEVPQIHIFLNELSTHGRRAQFMKHEKMTLPQQQNTCKEPGEDDPQALIGCLVPDSYFHIFICPLKQPYPTICWWGRPRLCSHEPMNSYILEASPNSLILWQDQFLPLSQGLRLTYAHQVSSTIAVSRQTRAERAQAGSQRPYREQQAAAACSSLARSSSSLVCHSWSSMVVEIQQHMAMAMFDHALCFVEEEAEWMRIFEWSKVAQL